MTESKEWTLGDLQREHAPWVAHNFGDRPAWMPLLGIVEEIGELEKAEESGLVDDIDDAIADIVIFMSDFSTAMGFNLEEMHTTAVESELPTPVSLSISAGYLAHSFLKLSQGIRGTKEEHLESMKDSCVLILNALYFRVWQARLGRDNIPEIVKKVWSQVSQRDFKKYPRTGLPEAPT